MNEVKYNHHIINGHFVTLVFAECDAPTSSMFYEVALHNLHSCESATQFALVRTHTSESRRFVCGSNNGNREGMIAWGWHYDG